MDMYVRSDHSSDSSDKTEFWSFASGTNVCICAAWACWNVLAILRGQASRNCWHHHVLIFASVIEHCHRCKVRKAVLAIYSQSNLT